MTTFFRVEVPASRSENPITARRSAADNVFIDREQAEARKQELIDSGECGPDDIRIIQFSE